MSYVNAAKLRSSTHATRSFTRNVWFSYSFRASLGIISTSNNHCFRQCNIFFSMRSPSLQRSARYLSFACATCKGCIIKRPVVSIFVLWLVFADRKLDLESFFTMVIAKRFSGKNCTIKASEVIARFIINLHKKFSRKIERSAKEGMLMSFVRHTIRFNVRRTLRGEFHHKDKKSETGETAVTL